MNTSSGVVVIGRNEGERLGRCLDTVVRSAAPVVYVDSGSRDASVATARAKGVPVIELDPSIPFTAARARNEGLRFLREAFADLAYVQFVDADCELIDGWLDQAVEFLDRHERVAAVGGRLREQFPQGTIYNMLCDIEWDVPAGEARACGGIFMVRAGAFESARGFRSDMICGEEPELCIRLRAAGWRIWRLPDPMASHDASMTRFGQWWKRSRRNGYGHALGASLHGEPPEQHGVRESRRAWFWGCALPLAGLACTAFAGPVGLLLFALYPLQVVRLALGGARSARENWWLALFLVVGKFAEMHGQLEFVTRRCLGSPARLIEYK
jgi:GT2 family glycosyltransferase